MNTSPETDELGEYVSYACDLENLTGSQLKSLLSLVGQKYRIRVSDGWNADRKVLDIILLIEDSVCENLDPEGRIYLDRMMDEYKKAIKNSGIDPTIIAPLEHCAYIAKHIKKKPSAKRKKGVKAKTIENKLEDLLHREPALSDCTAKQLASLLKCSASMIKSTPKWKDIVRTREGGRNAYLKNNETDDNEND